MFTFAKLTRQLWKYRVWQVAFVLAGLVSIAFFSLWRGNPAHLPKGVTTALTFQSACSGSSGGQPRFDVRPVSNRQRGIKCGMAERAMLQVASFFDRCAPPVASIQHIQKEHHRNLLSNIGLEPSHHKSCAIMSPRCAAQAGRFGVTGKMV